MLLNDFFSLEPASLDLEVVGEEVVENGSDALPASFSVQAEVEQLVDRPSRGGSVHFFVV